MKHRTIRIMAYVFMPLFFVLLGYALIYIVATPELEFLQTVVNIEIADEMPDFNQDLRTIYDPIIMKEPNTQQTDRIQGQNDNMNLFSDRAEALIPENTVDMKEVQFPDLGTHFARLTCERIGLDAPIYWGDTKEILSEGLGQFIGSFLPGFNRSILISGHNSTFFKPLQFLEVGDIIISQTNYGKYEYEVIEIVVMKAEEAENLMDEMLSYQEEKLIMYTCYPFEALLGNKQERLFVYADKISGPAVK